jgi:signal transduction histidine kinase
LPTLIGWAKEARDTKKILENEWRRKRPKLMENGEYETIELISTFIVLPLKGNEIGWISKDMTEFRQMQEQLGLQKLQLEKALEVKSRFLAVMSHGNACIVIWCDTI